MASLIRSDLEFILQQILIAEAHASGANPASLVPNTFAPFGLRTVDGTYNNLMPGQSEFGAADNPFPQLVDPAFVNEADGDTINLGPGGLITNNDYGVPGSVADADPRIISNLIVDMTTNNPAAVSAFVDAGLGTIDEITGDLLDIDGNIIPQGTLLTIPNVAPDEGLSAPFNSWFTFFGQFFDHGLDLVNKGGNETVFIPLQADDPLIPGPDGVLGTADDLPASQQFMVLTRGHHQRRRFAHQPDDSLRRPEPDLHLAPLAPGVPARVRTQRRWRSGGHRQADRRCRRWLGQLGRRQGAGA